MSLIKHTIKYSDGSVYRGYVNEAKQPHGQGTLTYADGSVLECTWLYGKANGQGRLSDGKKQPERILERHMRITICRKSCSLLIRHRTKKHCILRKTNTTA